MITLLTYPPAFNQPASSPFCVKAMYLLALSGVPWEREDHSDPRNFPMGKLPAIRDAGRVIGDSDAIRAHLAEQGADVDAHLNDLEQADARALTRMAEEHLYFHLVLDRWGDDAVWPTIRETYFAPIPKLVRGFVTRGLRKQALSGLHFTGLARLDPDQRMDRVEQDLSVLTVRLWQGPFLIGQRPCSADASVAAILSAMAATPIATRLSMRIAKDDVLMSYCDRVASACGAIPSA